LKIVVDDIEGHLITMVIKVEDTKGIVCSAKYQRTIINKGRLHEIAYQRSQGLD
jgi:predicted thioesterase